MKRPIQKISFLLWGLLSLMIVITACNEEDVTKEDPDNGQNQTTVADPNEVTSSLIFDDMKIISGSPPAVNASIGADLKINVDSIFWTEGVNNRIMIKRPEDVSLKGFWVFVAGSHSYIEATFREEEETEEIDILYFDFDPTGWEFPVSFPIEIIPFDENENGLDIIRCPGIIEEPYDPSGNCAFDYTSVKDESGLTYWEWVLTEDKANDFFAAPMYPFITNGTTMGCCVNGNSSQNPNCPESGRVELAYQNYYTISRETFKLSSDGFIGWSTEVTRNFDPGESDFCSNKAGYIYNDKYSAFGGEFQINEDCHLVFEYEVREPFVYVGSKFKPISKHYIEEVRGAGPEGGGGLRRVYVMRTAIEEGEPVGPWYD